MGFLDRMFSKAQYSELDESSLAANRIDRIREQLETLSKRVHKPLEVIPEEDGAYVFIGKPPKNFGVAWFEDGKLQNLKTLAEEKGVSPQELQSLSERLSSIYQENLDDARYTARIGKKNITVTPSEAFRNQISEVIRQASH